ncbi:hypothetical protein H072_4230 [Dactylellina haptotyla CBS 200.50]|uniref:Uncharacterized protein n=1 Tax=Dactylellina haptotyla (strain CBS 200.50) TaxID=1284197 RepID=S8C2J4_DACHA|nr:hypothetical protein H072_4230 [Dactylellina haptotyla CBS 200.50]
MELADKCWFPIGQTTYGPPDTKARTGLIQLGHLIPDLKSIDQVINAEAGPLPFRRGMVVAESTLKELDFSHTAGRDASIEVNAVVPIAAAAGVVSAGGKLGGAFKKSIQRKWQFERVDTHIFNPKIDYVRETLKLPEVVDYLKQATTFKIWTLFMISGIAIARNGKYSGSESSTQSIHGGPNVSVAGIVDAGLDHSFKTDGATASSYKGSSDYIWAVRLTKLHRGVFSELINIQTYNIGALYSNETDSLEIVLEDDGFGKRPVFQVGNSEDDGDDGNIFVMPEDFELVEDDEN